MSTKSSVVKMVSLADAKPHEEDRIELWQQIEKETPHVGQAVEFAGTSAWQAPHVAMSCSSSLISSPTVGNRMCWSAILDITVHAMKGLFDVH